MLRLDQGWDPCLASQLRAGSEGSAVWVHRVKGSPRPAQGRGGPLPSLGSHSPHLEATDPLKIWSLGNWDVSGQQGPGHLRIPGGWGRRGPDTHQLGFPRPFPPTPPPAGCLLSAEAASGFWGCGQVLPGIRRAPLPRTHPGTGRGLVGAGQPVGFLLFCHLWALLTCYSVYTRNNLHVCLSARLNHFKVPFTGRPL